MSLYSMAGGLLGLVALPAAILLTGLLLRNPLAPAWLRGEAAATAAGLALTVGVCLAISHAVSALAAAALPYWAIGVLVAVVPVASTLGLWRAFDIGDRLARAESGHSPFRRA
jgi:uncharacterized RDD family membrane protein YckC